MNMKTAAMVSVPVLVFSIVALVAFAQQDDIRQHANCKYCGMDRQKFDFSRMLIDYDDGTSMGVCSVHCAAVELATNIDKTPKAIMVGDATPSGWNSTAPSHAKCATDLSCLGSVRAVRY